MKGDANSYRPFTTSYIPSNAIFLKLKMHL